jgi:hypothetical protein
LPWPLATNELASVAAGYIRNTIILARNTSVAQPRHFWRLQPRMRASAQQTRPANRKSQELNYSARISLDRTQMVPFAFVLGKLH